MQAVEVDVLLNGETGWENVVSRAQKIKVLFIIMYLLLLKPLSRQIIDVNLAKLGIYGWMHGWIIKRTSEYINDII